MKVKDKDGRGVGKLVIYNPNEEGAASWYLNLLMVTAAGPLQ